MNRLRALAGALVVLAACGGGSLRGVSHWHLMDAAEPPPYQPGAYPAGPYGTDVGAVVRDFTFQGYYSPAATGLATSHPFGPVSFQQFRASGARYLYLLTGGFW